MNNMNMRFTTNFGGTTLEFFDVHVSVVEGTLVTTGYRKPTATNTILHHDSYHPQSVKLSVPYGQFVRLRRINNTDEGYVKQASELKHRLPQL